MPSALETLVKILKLELEQGCENRSVVGGLNAYAKNWKTQAITEAKRPEHFVLAEELPHLLADYENLDNQFERMKHIDYIMNRILGREPVPEAYLHLLDKMPDNRNTKKRAKNDTPSKPDKPKPKKTKTLESYGYDNYQVVAQQKHDLPQLPQLARPPRKRREPLAIDEAKQRLEALQKSVTTVKGIGNSKAEMLANIDIHSVDDMLRYLPRRYDDYTNLAYISQLRPDQVVTVIGTVASTQVRVGRNQRKDFHMTLEDGTGQLSAIFFGQHFLIRNIRKGQQLVLSGKVTIWGNQLQMSSPEWEALDSENLHTIGIVPVYRLTDGIKARAFRRMMKKTVEQFASQIPDHIPEAVLDRAELADIGWAFENLHFPEGFDHLRHARRRYIFDQLLTLQLGVLQNRRDWQAVDSDPITITDDWLAQFLSSAFPYELTGAQQRALNDIRVDITKTVPMNRLLQGDVGAGKTAVAVAAMAMAVQNRKQAALMAPTSILAEQHYRGISKIFENFPDDFRPVVALLTGALTQSERHSIYRGLDDGSIDVVIGTHAIIQEGVQFNDLGIAIIDEQHRFGVEQRAMLRGKGKNPHLLVMTATPIPRTLALTMHADLDLSILDEKPPGRQTIDTRMLEPVAREHAFDFIEQHLQLGRQAFIIHPLVEASEKVNARSAIEAYDELSQVFYKYRVCLLHGRMSPTEKDDIMAAFANHDYDVMVTTSVAEVGVDVPNANVILIEGANRFGLAQLHQFRGRVGRGAHQSFCLLIPDNVTPESEARLHALESTDDGFVLAEMDWKMRGAGDLLGTRQSGTYILQLAEEMTPELVRLAHQEALTIYAQDPDLEQEDHALLAEKVAILMSDDGGDIS